MKPSKTAILAVLIGLLLVAFAVSLAQETSQNTQAKKSESCCAMDSCCCHGDSCSMNTTDTTKSTEGCCSGKSCESMKNHTADHKGCCSGGESGDAAKMAAAENHSCCCCCNGDSCDMNAKHDKKNHSSEMACCNIKQKQKDTKGTTAKQKAD